ncbi:MULTISPECIES: hypothetical protein [Streptomyces]|uniref:hypothetical protein n=1 Tax=Streptomyces TaxID=1883 RepID=UPI000A3C3634|nr:MULTISPECIES: hypothetical protein [Streptomyces]MDI3096809.1 hypothetical protein [Streptomyces sp. AN-3]WDI19563.1 hypothetical protein PS783_19175 [Streptomyces enissocaesilis]WMI58266.1 hypothetical protein RBH85_16760 [Streptomyces rochei]WQC14013.1 hypothetical protein TR631_20300 [Streptomyces rochei]
MDILVTVIVLLAVIAAGALLIRRLNAQHGDRSAAFHYDRGGVVAPDQKTNDGPGARRRSPVANDADERRGPRYGVRGRLSPGRRTHGTP